MILLLLFHNSLDHTGDYSNGGHLEKKTEKKNAA